MTDGELAPDATAKAIAASKSLGDVTVLCCGASAVAAGDAAARIDGVAKVLVAEDASLNHRLAEATAALIVGLAGDYEHIVAPATTDAKNVMPRVAALLDVMVIPDISGVVDGSTFERPIYAGNVIQTVKSVDAKKVVTFRTSTFDAAGDGGSASVETVSAADNPDLSEWIEDKVAAFDRPELTSAGVIVSGGRGVGSEEDFALIEKLADKLGAAVGASRAAVDSGLMQVGRQSRSPGAYGWSATQAASAMKRSINTAIPKMVAQRNSTAICPNIATVADNVGPAGIMGVGSLMNWPLRIAPK